MHDRFRQTNRWWWHWHTRYKLFDFLWVKRSLNICCVQAVLRWRIKSLLGNITIVRARRRWKVRGWNSTIDLILGSNIYRGRVCLGTIWITINRSINWTVRVQALKQSNLNVFIYINQCNIFQCLNN